MSRMFHFFVLLCGLFTFTSTQAQTKSNQALRLLCENHDVSAYDLMTLRSDSVTEFIPSTISAYTMEGEKLFDFRQLHLISTDGLKAEAYAVAKKAGSESALYHLEINYALKSAEAHLVTENLTSRAVPFFYTVASDGLWVHGQKDVLSFYGFHDQKINRTLKLEGQLASRQNLVVRSINNGIEQLQFWNQNSWVLLGKANTKNQTLELASETSLDWLFSSEVVSGKGLVWRLLHKGKTLPLEIATGGRPFLFTDSSQTYLAWSQEGLDAKRNFKGQLQWLVLDADLKQVQIKQQLISDSIKSLVDKNNSSGKHVFNPIAYDAQQKAIIFTSGKLGGAARLNLVTEKFELFGAYGSSWGCHNPVTMTEVTTW